MSMGKAERMTKAEEMLQVLAAYGVEEYDARMISRDMVYIMDNQKHKYKPFVGADMVVPQGRPNNILTNPDAKQRVFHEPRDD